MELFIELMKSDGRTLAFTFRDLEIGAEHKVRTQHDGIVLNDRYMHGPAAEAFKRYASAYSSAIREGDDKASQQAASRMAESLGTYFPQ